jgi:hypothetical protein
MSAHDQAKTLTYMKWAISQCSRGAHRAFCSLGAHHKDFTHFIDYFIATSSLFLPPTTSLHFSSPRIASSLALQHQVDIIEAVYVVVFVVGDSSLPFDAVSIDSHCHTLHVREPSKRLLQSTLARHSSNLQSYKDDETASSQQHHWETGATWEIQGAPKEQWMGWLPGQIK